MYLLVTETSTKSTYTIHTVPTTLNNKSMDNVFVPSRMGYPGENKSRRHVVFREKNDNPGRGPAHLNSDYSSNLLGKTS